MKIKLFLAALLLIPSALLAQTVRGNVFDGKKEPLLGATVHWLGTGKGVSTNADGVFSISSKGISDKRLVARYVGYQADTIAVAASTVVEFMLKESDALKEVEVSGQRDDMSLTGLTPIRTEQISSTELKKAACCDLSGCFETQASVQPQTTNIVTNSKELRILGLSGVYNQVLIDGFPVIQALSYTYGISSYPGTLVENIYVAKGANSVLQGFESISGQINVETKDPKKTEKLLLNVYINNFMEKHLNANYAFKKGKWGNLTAFHTVQPANKTDRDKDTFLDLPLLTRYMVFNKWKYGDEAKWGWNSQIGMRLFNEKRIGGQSFFDSKTQKGGTEAYGQTVNLTQPEIWTKTGYRFSDKANLVVFASAFHQNQNAYFGTVKYDASQSNFYGNIQYERNYGENHVLKTGFSYRFMDLDENIAFAPSGPQRTFAGNYRRTESIPGLFAENMMRFFDDKLTWILGFRADDHNRFGTVFSPRTLLKYDLAKKTTLRANIGTGWRTVNLFSENIGLLVSSRDIVFAEALNPEKALNYGISLTQKFGRGKATGYVSADYYRTDFQNQVFPDYDSDPQKAIVKNFTGKSAGSGFQAELYLRLYERFEFKTGYNFLDVFRETAGKKQLLPFNPRHKSMTALSFRPPSDKFHIDANIHWYGAQRLPYTGLNPEEYRRADFSKAYSTVNLQFTYNFKQAELYAGCENIFDFRQKQPIMGWQNPFGPYFDTSFVWGPTRGREIYMGLRFKVLGGK